MPTPIWMESGSSATQDLSFLTSVVSDVSSTGVVTFTANRSFRLNNNPTSLGPFFSKKLILADAGRRISFRFMFDHLPVVGNDGQLVSLEAPSINGFQVSILTTGKLQISAVGVTSVSGSTVLAINTKYQLCVCFFVTNATTFRCSVYVNGFLDCSLSSGTMTTSVGITDLYISNHLDITATLPSVDLWVGDFYVDDGNDCSYPGNIRVVAKRPFSNGAVNGFATQIGAGGSAYGSGHALQVNELPLSQTNGWSMIGAGAAVTETYSIENQSTGDFDLSAYRIIGIMGWVFAKSLAIETASIIVDNGSSAIALTNTATMFIKISATPTVYPNGMEDIGIVTATDLTTVSLYECGIFVAFVPADLTVLLGEPVVGSSIF